MLKERFTTGQIASRLALELHGEADIEITHVSALTDADQGSVTFLSNPKFLPLLATTTASVVILRSQHVAECPCAALVSNNPYLSYAKISQLLFPVKRGEPGIAESAVIGNDTQIADSASIAPFVSIGERVVVGERVVIAAGVVIGDDAVIGDDCRIDARVTVEYSVEIGARCHIASGAVIGSDGFGYANDAGEWVKISQVGSVTIGNDVDIGANTTIDRGAISDTIIGNGVIIDNQVQIAHNVTIGDHTAIAGCSGIAGSAQIGKYCSIGGSANIIGHLSIADHTTITAQSFVTQTIAKAGVYSSGVPLQENNLWRRNYTRFKQLDELTKRLIKLENKNRS